MFGFWKHSLAAKFVVITMLVVFVLMGISTYVNYQSQKKTIYDNIRMQSEMLGNFVSSITPDPDPDNNVWEDSVTVSDEADLSVD